MNPEARQPIPDELKESPSKQRLRELEKAGDYVFHGTSMPDIDNMQVRQPYTWKGNVRIKHGEPAVVATPYSDIAIFRSLVYKYETNFGVKDARPHFAASQEALDQAIEPGFVYVFSRTNFKPLEGDETSMDWRAYSDQKPLEVIEVSHNDLPDQIKIVESDKD